MDEATLEKRLAARIEQRDRAARLLENHRRVRALALADLKVYHEAGIRWYGGTDKILRYDRYIADNENKHAHAVRMIERYTLELALLRARTTALEQLARTQDSASIREAQTKESS